MIRSLFLFALLLLSIYLGIQLSHDPGYVLVTINHWALEATLLVTVVALLILFLLLHGLLVMINKMARLPGDYSHWRARKRAHKAQKTTRQGLIEFSEGYWSQAEKHLIKALPDTDTPLLNYLTAARAAQEMGDNQLRDDYLREAQQSVPDAKIAVELTQAQLQLADKQWEQALATLRHLHDLVPHHPYVLKLLMHLYQEVRDWPQLLALLPELKKYKVLEGSNFEKLRLHTFLQFMSDLCKIPNDEALSALLNELPKELKYNPELMDCYCSYLIKSNQLVAAETLLRRCLQKGFSEKLISLYGQFYLDEKQLTFAESLLKKQNNSAALYLCLGRLSLADQLWGKARHYLETSITLQATPTAYAELGKLFEKLGEHDQACLTYRQGLDLNV